MRKAEQDKAYKERLAEWRQKHFAEMKTNLEIAKEIRDDSTAKAKDRIDAIKTISRMLGTLAPEKIEKRADKPKKESPLTEAENQEINDKFSAILGDAWTKNKKS